MIYPELQEINASREMIDVFKGYNHNLRIGNGEFYDMTNLTSADYPTLSPRPQRGVYEQLTKPQGIIAKDALCYVDNGKFYINKEPIEALSLNDKPKTLISMGAYVIIMPDKKYVDTANWATQTEFNIEASFPGLDVSKSKVTFSLCKLDGANYQYQCTEEDENGEMVTTTKDPEPSPIAPPNPSNLALWIDSSSTPHTLKQYDANKATWVSIATTYVKISSVGIGEPFAENDGVIISINDKDKNINIYETMVIRARGDDYIVVTGIIDEAKTLEIPIKVERRMPNMDFIIESENRLWGCCYGVALNGQVVNEIYASKLGDFKNWHCFEGISTDSYVASVGSDGQFTGAITHLGYPLFFKENCMYKVYGNYPSNYQIQNTICRGVQKGCSKSLAIVNETLYYKARSAICAFDGSLPVEMSSALGEIGYGDAVAGVLGNKYYISMRDGEGVYHLFVYDTLKGMWHREDNTQVQDFCNRRGNLYYIDAFDKDIKTVRGINKLDDTEIILDTSPVKWEAITGIIGTDSPDKKYVSRLDVRLKLTPGSVVTFYAEYDSSEAWEHLFTMNGTTLRSFAVPIRPKRCDHLRLRIVGRGDIKIYSICKTIEQGSDV